MTGETSRPAMSWSGFALALKYYGAGLYAQAWDSLHEILDDPNPPREALQLGAALRYDAGDLAQAFALCERILSHTPDDPDALLVHGRILLDQGHMAEAVQGLRAAVTANPMHAAAHFNLGLALERAGELTEAADAYRAAIARQDPYPDAWNNLGLVLEQIGETAVAVEAFEAAIRQAPDFQMAYANLGALLIDQGQLGAAIRACGAAVARDPQDLSAYINQGVALLEQGRHGEAKTAFDSACALNPGGQDAADNAVYLQHYISNDPGEVMAAHAAWGTRFSTMGGGNKVRKTAPKDRLRIGYVSPDFRRHSVSFFIEPLLANHDRRVVEIFCYADGRPDNVTQRLKTHAEHWRQISGRADDDVFQVIQDDNIDILVDLAGHTKGNRLSVFARRAAPVQVTALGYPGTTGLAQMDFRFCDVITDPPGSEPWASERLIRLQTGLHCYQAPCDAPALVELPSRTRGFVTFGSFNKLGKVSEATVALWSKVLLAVPSARLFLKSRALADAETRAFTAARFQAHGVAADNLTLLGWVPDEAGHLAAYGQIDIALDTFPYSGTTTTCEALWMGVPVLTLAGQTHASRVSASLLTGLGLAAWVTDTPEAFVARAVAAVADSAGLRALRAGLRDRMRAAPLCDGVGYAAAVEAAYRTMWAG